LSEDLRRIEEAVERAVRRALAEARAEDLRILAEAVKTLADYVREGFKIFDERLRRIEERFEKIDERFEKIDERFKKRRLSTLENNVKYLMSAVNELKSALGVTMEDYTAVWLSRWLEEKGYKCDVRTRITIVVNPTTGDSREVDVICWNPLVVGEVTTTIRTVEEAEREIKKLLDSVTYAEKVAGAKHYAKILAVEIAPSEIAEYLERKARELDITLVLGRRY
jgi:predicted mannosyl-3-phosphoglycerate phosphatase (HAD superfamily)